MHVTFRHGRSHRPALITIFTSWLIFAFDATFRSYKSFSNLRSIVKRWYKNGLISHKIKLKQNHVCGLPTFRLASCRKPRHPCPTTGSHSLNVGSKHLLETIHVATAAPAAASFTTVAAAYSVEARKEWRQLMAGTQSLSTFTRDGKLNCQLYCSQILANAVLLTRLQHRAMQLLRWECMWWIAIIAITVCSRWRSKCNSALHSMLFAR